MKYPNGQEYVENKKITQKKNLNKSLSSANRGMNLESDINNSNLYYKEKDIALITKRPTPINVVKVDYSHGAKITHAYFESQSTTDYNGIYKSRYLDFEAKNTKSKTSFPLSNITKHQIEHLKKVIFHHGIAFFIIRFDLLDEVYLLDAKDVIEHFEKSERRSIPYSYFQKHAHLIKQGLYPRLDYMEIVEKLYF